MNRIVINLEKRIMNTVMLRRDLLSLTVLLMGMVLSAQEQIGGWGQGAEAKAIKTMKLFKEKDRD